MKYLICDIDGTVALRGDRSPFDYSRVLEDEPNFEIINIVRLHLAAGWGVIFVSGRESTSEELTREFLSIHFEFPFLLFMRDAGDYRPDDEVKFEIYEQQILHNYDVRFVLDDRARTVKMWRDRARLTTLQVAPGEF